MRRHTRAAWLLGAALLVPSPLSLQAQVMPAANVTKPASEAAAAAFRKAFFEAQNVGGERATRQLDLALKSDPQYGLAQAYQAVLNTDLSGADRAARISATMGALGSASPAEVLLVAFWREQAAGRGPAALPIIRAAAELAPTDAEINYIYNNQTLAGKKPAEAVAALKTFVQRFPNHAAAYNNLAYTAWRAGDRDGALAAVQKYEQLAPDHPNAHDTYADILLLLGRPQEAIQHAERIRQIDPEWPFIDAKIGAAELAMGNVKGARTRFEQLASRVTDPTDRIETAYWLAAVDVVGNNTKGAIQQVARIVDVADKAGLRGPTAIAHERLAVLEAYAGNRKNVAGHLAAASPLLANDAQKAGYQALSAVALSRAGQAEAARTAADEFARLLPGNAGIPVLEAVLALDRQDYGAAETALSQAPTMDVLPRALRAELLARTGRKAEADALRKELMTATVKQDGNPPVDFNALIGRLRLASM